MDKAKVKLFEAFHDASVKDHGTFNARDISDFFHEYDRIEKEKLKIKGGEK